MKFNLLGLLLVPFILAGCQSSTLRDRTENTQHSYAWNVNNASNMDVFYDKDVAPGIKSKFSDPRYYWGFASDPSPYNLSRLDLSSVINYHYPVGMETKDWQFDKMLIWVPKALATSEEQARMVAENALNEALNKTWPGIQFNKRTVINAGLVNGLSFGYIGSPTRLSTYFLWDNDAACKTNRFPNQSRPDACLFFISAKPATGLIKTPAFAASDSAESYVLDPSYFSIDITNNNHPGMAEERNIRALLQKLSNNLPAWMVIYLAPDERKGLPAVVLQQGKSHFFIK